MNYIPPAKHAGSWLSWDLACPVLCMVFKRPSQVDEAKSSAVLFAGAG